MITEEQINNWFTYHAPASHSLGSEEVQMRYEVIREAGREFAERILDNTPPSADQTAAIRKVREAVFTANAALACEGK